MAASLALRVARRVADQVGAGAVERRFGEPADGGVDLLDRGRHFVGLDDHVAARGVDLVGEQQRDRLLGDRLREVDAADLDRLSRSTSIRRAKP